MKSDRSAIGGNDNGPAAGTSHQGNRMDAANDQVTELAAAIARQLKTTIPLSVDLWDSAHLGAYFKCTPRNALERYAALPGFPKAIRLPSGKQGRGHPLYKAVEVIEWAERHRERKSA